MRRLLPGLLILVVVLAAAPLLGAERDSGVFRDPLTQSVFVSGGTVQFSGSTDDDLYVAGFSVNLTGARATDIAVAGFDLILSDISADDVLAAGFTISIGGTIADDVIAAASTITLSDQARLGGGAVLSGEAVTVRGDISGGLRIAANTAVIDGEVAGDVVVRAPRVEIGPNARIGGTLRHSSLTFDRHPDAEIGAIEAGPPPEGGEDEDVPEAGETLVEAVPKAVLQAFAALYAVFSVAEIVLAVVLYLLFPHIFNCAADEIRGRTAPSLGLGIAIVIAVPIVAVMVVATLLGAAVGLYAIGAYLLLLAPGSMVTALWLAEEVWRRYKPDAPWPPKRLTGVGLLLAGSVVLWLAGLIPLIGGLFVLAATAAGVGGLLLTLQGHLSFIEDKVAAQKQNP